MCLIYYRDSRRHGAPDYDALRTAYEQNPDGVGIAWHAGQWRAWRSVDASWRQVAKRLHVLEQVERVVVHFRWATHGGYDVANCHSFEVAPESFLFHNGTFAGVDGEDDESDTRQVAQRLAKIVARGGRLVDAWQLLKLLSDGNRLLLTLPGGKVAYAGRWVSRADGCYSNGRCLQADTSFADWYRDFA